MKCPKCGYNSFEYHGSCKKCSADFADYKRTYAITPIVLPPEVRLEKAEQFQAFSSEDTASAEHAEAHNDMFAFDLPEETPPAQPVTVQNDDPFNFDYDLPDMSSPTEKVAEGVFADVNGTAAQAENPFAASAAPESSSSAGEFDLDSFSWNETPAATPPDTDKTAGAASVAVDDFDFFNDLTDAGKK